MTSRGRMVAAMVLLGSLAVQPGRAAEPAEDFDTAYLRRHGIATDGPSLPKFLSEWVATPDRQAIDALVRDLGADGFDKREKASKQLVAVGPPALEALRKAAKEGDAETKRRAQECIQAIESDKEWQYRQWQLPVSAARVVARTRPPGAIKALLQFLPAAADEEAAEEVWYALDRLVRAEGKVDAALAGALGDDSAARRAAAALLVARYGDAQQRAAACARLDDADPGVRLRAAQGLLGAKDKRGAPALIKLLGEKDLALAWQAEELLRWTADEDAPAETIGAGSAEPRQKCRGAWEAWWRERGERLDLAKRPENWRRPGLMVLCELEEGRVWLCGCDGKPRCEWTGLRKPAEARLVPGPRVLIAECPSLFPDGQPEVLTIGDPPGRVTERDPAGQVCWEYKKVRDPLECRRLPNGDTFIAGTMLLGGVVTPQGQVVSSILDWIRPNSGLYCPRLTQDGRLLGSLEGLRGPFFRTSEFRLGPKYERTAQFDACKPRPYYSVEDVNAMGYLVSGLRSDDVIEFTWAGPKECKPVWVRRISGSRHASRLVSGETAVAAKGRIVMLDREGNTIGDVFCDRALSHVRPCLSLVRLGFDGPPALDRDGDVGLLMEYRIAGLKNRNPLVRRLTCVALAEVGIQAVEAGPALAEAMKDADDGVRREAKAAFEKVGGEEFPRLLAVAKDKTAPVKARCDAIWRLSEYTGAAKPVAPVFIAALKDDNAKVRGYAANCLAGMRSQAETVVPALIKAAEDPDADVRFYAVHSLGRIGAFGKMAAPVLIRRLKDENGRVKHFAAQSLGMIGAVDKQVVPALTEALKDEQARLGAARALGAIGQEARSAFPEMLEALDAPVAKGPPELKDLIQQSVVFYCGRLGPNAVRAVPVLVKILDSKSTSESLMRETIRALGAIGPAAREAIPALERIPRQDRHGEEASEALSKIQPRK